MPDCAAGESAQDYFARVLAQCSLESATSAENTSGDSTPTPFNLGQIQNDLARAQEDIDQLETDVGTLQTDVTTLQTTVGELNTQSAAGTANYLTSDTSVEVALPGTGSWRAFVMPINKALDGLYVTMDVSSFTIHFDAAASDGSVYWFITQE